MKKGTRTETANVVEMFETPADILDGGASSEQSVAYAPESETNIEATALLPGQECPFTNGCRGKVHIFNTINRTIVDPATKRPRVETHQQLKCNKCNVPAVGSRIASGGQARTGKFFNRITGKTEQT